MFTFNSKIQIVLIDLFDYTINAKLDDGPNIIL